jgi:hypothetical protein
MDSPRYPGMPWQMIGALLLSLVILYGSVRLWLPHLPLLQREYLGTYALLSTTGLHKQDQPVIINGNHLATLQESGVFHRGIYRIQDKEAFRQWLQVNIYEGQGLRRFALVPEILTLLFAVPLFMLACWHHRISQGEARDGRLLRGPRLVSNLQFNWRMLLNKKNRGFYIETK